MFKDAEKDSVTDPLVEFAEQNSEIEYDDAAEMVIKGEVWAVLDIEEKLMRASDVLVQRGTNHAWANRTNDPCLVMFVQCGAIRLLV